MTALRIVAWLEAISYALLLLVAMPLKYLAGLPQATRVAGSLHGLLFLAFVAALYTAASEHVWPRRRTLRLFAWSLVPGGIFAFERELRTTAPTSSREQSATPGSPRRP